MGLFSNRALESEAAQLRDQNRLLAEENEALKDHLRALREELERATSTSGREQQLNDLMTFQNENVKGGIADIQVNLAESVGVAKAALNTAGSTTEEFGTCLRIPRVLSISSCMDSTNSLLKTHKPSVGYPKAPTVSARYWR